MATKKTAVIDEVQLPAKKPRAKKSVVEQEASVAVEVLAEAPPKKSKKEPKTKVVRDSFTMPQDEYQQIVAIKEAMLKGGIPVKKSEVLRAGLKLLVATTPARMKRTFQELEKIQTGRPKKH